MPTAASQGLGPLPQTHSLRMVFVEHLPLFESVPETKCSNIETGGMLQQDREAERVRFKSRRKIIKEQDRVGSLKNGHSL